MKKVVFALLATFTLSGQVKACEIGGVLLPGAGALVFAELGPVMMLVGGGLGAAAHESLHDIWDKNKFEVKEHYKDIEELQDEMIMRKENKCPLPKGISAVSTTYEGTNPDSPVEPHHEKPELKEVPPLPPHSVTIIDIDRKLFRGNAISACDLAPHTGVTFSLSGTYCEHETR